MPSLPKCHRIISHNECIADLQDICMSVAALWHACAAQPDIADRRRQ